MLKNNTRKLQTFVQSISCHWKSGTRIVLEVYNPNQPS